MLIRALRRIPIGLRLYLGFGASIVLLAAALVSAGLLAHQDRARLVSGLQEASEMEHLADQMRSSILSSAMGMRNLVLQSEVGPMQKQEVLIKQDLKAFRHSRAELADKKGLSASERETLNALIALEQQLHRPFEQAFGLSLSFDSDGAIKMMNTQVEPLQAKLLDRLTEFADLQTQKATDLFAAAEASGRVTNRLLAAIGAAAGVLAALSTIVMIRSITVPLDAVVQAVDQVARGDLREVALDDARDEVSRVRKALATMTHNLTSMVQRVRDSSDSIAAASKQIATGNGDLSARTENQAAGLQETASSMQQLTATVRANATQAQNASAMALTAVNDAETGGQLMSDVVGTMTSIQSASSRVTDITGVIDGIAFQTNILALNAAVEAARAGEHGRGFAVVAQEVRTLAQRSATAAKEIKTLIAESTGRVHEGSRLVSKAGETMAGIVRGIKAVTDAVTNISVSSQQQAEGIHQVNSAVEQMDRGTQQNAALVEESAAAAASLEAQARRLTEVVAEFRTA